MRGKLKAFALNNYVRVLLLLTPTTAFADGSSTMIDTVLNNFLSYLTSTPARILATIAIVGVGYASWHLGKLPKEKAIAVIIGIGIVFGGTTILNMLKGQ